MSTKKPTTAKKPGTPRAQESPAEPEQNATRYMSKAAFADAMGIKRQSVNTLAKTHTIDIAPDGTVDRSGPATKIYERDRKARQSSNDGEEKDDGTIPVEDLDSADSMTFRQLVETYGLKIARSYSNARKQFFEAKKKEAECAVAEGESVPIKPVIESNREYLNILNNELFGAMAKTMSIKIPPMVRSGASQREIEDEYRTHAQLAIQRTKKEIARILKIRAELLDTGK